MFGTQNENDKGEIHKILFKELEDEDFHYHFSIDTSIEFYLEEDIDLMMAKIKVKVTWIQIFPFIFNNKDC